MIKKVLASLLSASILFSSVNTNTQNITQNKNLDEIDFEVLPYETVDYDKTPLVVSTTDSEGEKINLIFTKTEGFYYKNGEKIVVIEVVDAKPSYITQMTNNFLLKPMAVPMNKFLKDFYYTGSFVPKEFRIKTHTGNFSLGWLTDTISSMALTFLGIPENFKPSIKSAAQFVASVIMDNPPEYAIRLNIRYYKNKRCSSYLNGQTFNMVVKGRQTNRMYYYWWGENPSLGIVDGSCKIESRTYPYASGYGK